MMQARVRDLGSTSSTGSSSAEATGGARAAMAALVAAVAAAATLVGATTASAFYPPDGLKVDPLGGYMNPNDGMCVIGVAPDGTMLVDWDITNARDCAVWQVGGGVDLRGVATSGACADSDLSGTGYRHTWSSICFDSGANTAISRVDLDNTEAMCRAKGGTLQSKCVAYGWQYRDRLPDGSLPVSGTGIGTTQGVTFAQGLGFCAASMRMNSATYTSAATCPSYHNSATLAPAEWPACLSSSSGCQTQESYDLGLGWSWDSTNSRCLYSYGVTGNIDRAATKADGTTWAAGTFVDLTTASFDTMGECLANGFTWDNWLPNASTDLVDNSDIDWAGLPDGARIRRLDAISDIEDGGGDFYSGTGAVCAKCHTDQSRGYAERDKPGFYLTRHKAAGDAVGKPFQPFFDSASPPAVNPWGLNGVQCAMCHSTAKPAQDDLIQVNPAGTTGAGLPKSATGHNNTEYGSQLVTICYTCHGTAASPSSVNPASVIPVSGGEFELTDKGLEPIANQFLNSPHGLYTGSSEKVDIGRSDLYESHFNGYICRGPATSFRNYTQSRCTNEGHTWYTPPGASAYCYYNATSCAAVPTGQWTTSFDALAYPWAALTGSQGPGGVCKGIGLGAILTTYWRGGEAHKIHFVNSSSNPDCTNFSTAATPGAAGYWVRDGEVLTGVAPGFPTDTSQGSCMTCHDVHWALADESPEAEPIRRECTTCHAKDLGVMKHPEGGGTPLEAMDTDPMEACVTCHMPSEQHLFRISTDAAYSTFPSATLSGTQANASADGDYADASWVDLDAACGQCHGGGTAQASAIGSVTSGSDEVAVDTTAGFVVGQRVVVAGAGDLLDDNVTHGDLETHVIDVGVSTLTLAQEAEATVAGAAVEQNPTRNNAAYLTKAELAPLAEGIHNDNPVAQFGYTFGKPNTLVVNVNAGASLCSAGCNAYGWDWGDGSPDGSGVTASHTYAAAGTYTITLTVDDYGVGSGSISKNVTVKAPDLGPTAAGTCNFDPNTWTMILTDASTDDNGIAQVVVNWGDGSMIADDRTAPFGPFSRTYRRAGSFTIKHSALDTIGQKSTRTCNATTSKFMIAGAVYQSDGTTPVASATVRFVKNGILARTVYTAANGQFSATGLKPGAYNLLVSKVGHTFASPAATVSVGPDSLLNVIEAVTP